MRITLAVDVGGRRVLRGLRARVTEALMTYAEHFGSSPHEDAVRARGLMLHLCVEAVRVLKDAAAGAHEVSIKEWHERDRFELALSNGRAAWFSREGAAVGLTYYGFPVNATPLAAKITCEPGETVEAAARRWMGNALRELTTTR